MIMIPYVYLRTVVNKLLIFKTELKSRWQILMALLWLFSFVCFGAMHIFWGISTGNIVYSLKYNIVCIGGIIYGYGIQ